MHRCPDLSLREPAFCTIAWCDDVPRWVAASAASKRLSDLEDSLKTRFLKHSNRDIEATAVGAETPGLARNGCSADAEVSRGAVRPPGEAAGADAERVLDKPRAAHVRSLAGERPQGRRLAATAPPRGRRNTWGGPAFVSHELACRSTALRRALAVRGSVRDAAAHRPTCRGIEMRDGVVVDQRFTGRRGVSIIRPISRRAVDGKLKRGSQGVRSTSPIEVFSAYGLSGAYAQRNDPISTRAQESTN
jgi:hypothetical protein